MILDVWCRVLPHVHPPTHACTQSERDECVFFKMKENWSEFEKKNWNEIRCQKQNLFFCEREREEINKRREKTKKTKKKTICFFETLEI